jgi:hypothetical protein
MQRVANQGVRSWQKAGSWVLILGPEYEGEALRILPHEGDPLLGVSLPEGATLRRFGLGGFIGFSADWKPSFFPSHFRRSVFKPYRSLFKFALRPVFESFGLEWQPLPVSAATVLAKAVIALPRLLMLLLGLFSIAASL